MKSLALVLGKKLGKELRLTNNTRDGKQCSYLPRAIANNLSINYLFSLTI